MKLIKNIFSGETLSEAQRKLLKIDEWTNDLEGDHELLWELRTDPDLIKSIEDGDTGNNEGWYGLVIVEIPDGSNWFVTEDEKVLYSESWIRMADY